MEVVPYRWHTKLLLVFLFVVIQTGICQAAFKRDKTTKVTSKSHHHHEAKVKKEKRFMSDSVPKGRVVYSFATDRNRYLPRRPRLYRAYIIKRPLTVQQSTTNADGRQNIPFMEVEPTYHQQLVRVHPIEQPIYYYQPADQQELTDFDEPLNDPDTMFPGDFSGTLYFQISLKRIKCSQRLLAGKKYITVKGQFLLNS